MHAADPASVVAYDPAWPVLFGALALTLRRELADLALRIDHIGSTSVPDLDAKPIIDIQISVESLEPVSAYAPALERAGFLWRSDNPELSKAKDPFVWETVRRADGWAQHVGWQPRPSDA